MTESKHTPGPWDWRDRSELRAKGADGRYGDLVAGAVYEYDCGAFIEASDADRDLIAAAPDLLRELRHLVRLLEPMEREGGLDVPGLATLNGARAAIARATGEHR